MAEMRQLKAACSREYQSHSAPIKKVGAFNKQSTKTRGHLAMQNEIMIQGEEGEQNRMAGGGAGQHTTQTSKTLPKDSIKIYRVKRSGRTNVGNRNLGQSVTQTTIRGRCGGARTDRRCGGIDTRKLHGRSRQQGGRRCRLQDSCVVIIFDEAPRYREVQSKLESKHLIMKAYRDRASSHAETREETRPQQRSDVFFFLSFFCLER